MPTTYLLTEYEGSKKIKIWHAIYLKKTIYNTA